MTDSHQTEDPRPQPMPEPEREDLPSGWVVTTLGEVIKQTGQRVPEKSSEFTYIDIASVDRISKRITEPQRLNGAAAPSRARKEIQTNDVLVSMTRPNLNAVAVVPADLNGQIASTGFDILRAAEIDYRWIFYFVRSKSFVDEISEMVRGALYPAVSSAEIRSFSLPLPPLPEQIRIADKLDTLLTRIEAGRERLGRMPALLSRLRQSILSAAVSGELTREWRGGGDAEWEEVKLGDLLESLRNGVSAKPSEDATGRPILKISSVRPFKVTTEQGRFVPLSAEEFERFNLRLNDLLVTRYNGSLELLGIGGIVRNPDLLQFTYPDKLMRLRFKDTALPPLVEIILNAPSTRTVIEGIAKTTSGQTGISGQDLKALEILLPSLTEQAEIVRRVQLLFTRVDALERQTQAAAKAYDLLKPALLQKAFRGELVPQDPNDEPASVLLKRIRAARGTASTGKGGRTPKPQAQASAVQEGGAKPKRGRPRKANTEAGAEVTAIPTASSFEDAIEQLKGLGHERTQGTRQSRLFEE